MRKLKHPIQFKAYLSKEQDTELDEILLAKKITKSDWTREHIKKDYKKVKKK